MNTLKTIRLAAILVLFLGFFSCNSDDPDPEKVTLDVLKIENLHAPADVRDHTTGQIISEGVTNYFSFSQGKSVMENENWDIAFKGTSIIVNSGIHGSTDAAAAVVIATFSEVEKAPEDNELKVDTAIVNAIASGSGNGWYNYNPSTHMITPIAGRVIVVRTFDGKYAKMEMLSYYKDQATNPGADDDDYLTFNYVYQNDGSKDF